MSNNEFVNPLKRNLSSNGLTEYNDLLNKLNQAIMTYQGIEEEAWEMSSSLKDTTGNFDAKRNAYLTQQKILNLQSERDNAMQKLIGDYMNNTDIYSSSLKLGASKDYVSKLQDNLNNVNSNKLSSINSDIMTFSRVASINVEKYNKTYRINKYFAITIIFLCILGLLLVLRSVNFSWIPKILLKYSVILLFIGYLITIAIKIYIDSRQYRMLNMEKDFNPPVKDSDNSPSPTCTTCCGATSSPTTEEETV